MIRRRDVVAGLGTALALGTRPARAAVVVGTALVGTAPWLAAAVPGVEITRADVLPEDPVELAGVLSGCPLALVTLNQLTDAGRPGVALGYVLASVVGGVVASAVGLLAGRAAA